MAGMATCRVIAARWRFAMAQHRLSMRAADPSGPARPLSTPLDHCRHSRCSADGIGAASPRHSAYCRPLSARASTSADQKTVQMQGDKSQRRRRGLQSHNQSPSSPQNGKPGSPSAPSSADSNGASAHAKQQAAVQDRLKANGSHYRAAQQNGAIGAQSQQQSELQSRQLGRQADSSQSSSTSRQPAEQSRALREAHLPPHLFTPRGSALHASHAGKGAETVQASETPANRASKAAAEQLTARLPPPEVGDLGERAEGVIQIGTSGVRIPLYGRTMQSIQEVPALPAGCLALHVGMCLV